MANIQLTDANSNQITSFQLGDFAAVGMIEIPTMYNPAVGWYRIADIDLNGLTNVPYTQVFIMTGGQYASGIPSEYAIVASLPGYGNSAHTRVVQLCGSGGNIGNYSKIRFTASGTLRHIEVYQTYEAVNSRGRQVFIVAATGGKLKPYKTPQLITTDPATIYATYTLQPIIGSGAISLERRYGVGGSTAGTYLVFARFPLGVSSSRAHISLMVCGGGNYSSVRLGTFILDCAGRSNNVCQQTTLVGAGSASGMEFGTYISDGYVYVGMKRPAYSSEFVVKILNQTSNASNSLTGVELDTYYESTTSPTGWTAATIV